MTEPIISTELNDKIERIAKCLAAMRSATSFRDAEVYWKSLLKLSGSITEDHCTALKARLGSERDDGQRARDAFRTSVEASITEDARRVGMLIMDVLRRNLPDEPVVH